MAWANPCNQCGGPGGWTHGEGHTFGCSRYKGPGLRQPRAPRKARAPRPGIVGRRVLAREKLRHDIPRNERGTILSVLGEYYRVAFDNGKTTSVRKDLLEVT